MNRTASASAWMLAISMASCATTDESASNEASGTGTTAPSSSSTSKASDDVSSTGPGSSGSSSGITEEDSSSTTASGTADTTAGTDPWLPVRDAIDAWSLSDLTVLVGDAEGIRFSHSKGESTPQTVYRLASASKWTTAAVLMSLVEEGVLSLDSTPSQAIEWWTSAPDDLRSQITLRQMLGFTTGFSGSIIEPVCIVLPNADPDACLMTTYEADLSFAPGEAFYYGPKHMQVAGAMATASTGEDWNTLWRSRVADPLGLSPAAVYDVPSLTHPRASAGLSASATDYGLFLRGLLDGALLADSSDEFNADSIGSEVEILYSPVAVPGQQWHYALGHWLECEDPFVEDCELDPVLSSPGAFGTYPFLIPSLGYWAVLAREEAIDVGRKPVSSASVVAMQAVRPLIETALAQQ